MATINFTNNADVVYAYDYGNGTVNHRYNLLKGEDKFYGDNARDTVYGGDGADTIFGGAGNDTLYGDTGWDVIYGSAGADTIYGGDGNDTLYGGDDAERDVIFGGNGHDKILADADKVNGGAGNDQVSVDHFGDGEYADVTLGAGRDTVFVNIHADYIPTRIDIRDFKAEDTLRFDHAHGAGVDADSTIGNAEVLDRLDLNNDGWLGVKDVKPASDDTITVHVGQNFLELEVFGTSVFLHGMTKASFDFLA